MNRFAARRHARQIPESLVVLVFLSGSFLLATPLVAALMHRFPLVNPWLIKVPVLLLVIVSLLGVFALFNRWLSRRF